MTDTPPPTDTPTSTPTDETKATWLLKQGIPAHRLTHADRSKGGKVAQARRRAKLAKLEERAVLAASERMVRELHACIETYIAIRDDPDAPESARIQAADRIVERLMPAVKADGGGKGAGQVQIVVQSIAPESSTNVAVISGEVTGRDSAD